MDFREFARVGHLPTLIGSLAYFTVHVMLWVLVGNLTVFIANEFDLSVSQQGAMAALIVLRALRARWQTSWLQPTLLR